MERGREGERERGREVGISNLPLDITTPASLGVEGKGRVREMVSRWLEWAKSSAVAEWTCSVDIPTFSGKRGTTTASVSSVIICKLCVLEY